MLPIIQLDYQHKQTKKPIRKIAMIANTTILYTKFKETSKIFNNPITIEQALGVQNTNIHLLLFTKINLAQQM